MTVSVFFRDTKGKPLSKEAYLYIMTLVLYKLNLCGTSNFLGNVHANVNFTLNQNLIPKYGNS